MNSLISNLFQQTTSTNFRYGTSGFRDRAEKLLPIVPRVGFVTVLRCAKLIEDLKLSKSCGLMITASHNPVKDNGLKIVDHTGSMLPVEWEVICTNIVNAGSEGQLRVLVGDLFCNLNEDFNFEEIKIFVGMDTRPSSLDFKNSLLSIFSILRINIIDLGLVTTPQLHFAVLHSNTVSSDLTKESKFYLDNYYNQFSSAFNKFAEKLPLRSIEECTVDVANGVGGVALTEVASKLKDKLSVTIRNNGDGVLNEGCGADFVITNQKAPFELEKNKCYCSLDGDADRIVFYSCDAEDSFLLLDGDRITCLLVHTIQNLMLKTELSDRFHITAVQTAYANGASTDYLQKTLKVKVLCTSTGVKHLHRAAEESSDIGVYFESNGHGTVIFSRAFKDFIQQNEKTSPDFELLQLLIDMTNSAIGDALTDLLLVVSCLNYLEWGLKEWSGIYQEWLSKLTKAKVKDRYLLKVTNADRTIVEPEGMQSELNKLIESVNERSSKPEVKARCFIRPSGTEDIVRIYAEASSESDLNEIIIGAENLIMKYLE